MARIIGGLDDTPVQIQEKPYSPTDPAPDPEGSTFMRSVARGTDSLQATLYASANIIGNLTGFNALEEWGEEGVARNLAEMAENPPEIHSWDDVDSLADFGTYWLEAIGEQAPQLAADLLSAATGAGLASVAGRRAAKAAIGKKLKRQIGEKHFSQFQALRGKVPAGALAKAQGYMPKTTGAAAGLYLSNIAQNAGETQMGFLGEDIDAPGTALLAGVAKGALDTMAPLELFRMARKAGVAPSQLSHVVGRTAKKFVGLGLLESGTEGVQTVIDHIAQNVHDPDFDMFDESSWVEIREAMIKGGLVGGTLGGTVSAVKEGMAYRQVRQDMAAKMQSDREAYLDMLNQQQQSELAERDAEAEVNRRMAEPPATHMVPEAQEVIDAQAATLGDPTSTKDTIEVTGGSPQPSDGVLPDNVYVIPTENGIAYTTNEDKARIIKDTGGDEATMGSVLYGKTDGKTGTDGRVIVGRNAEGVPVVEVLTNAEAFQTDAAEVARQTPATGRVEISDAPTVIAEREARLQGLDTGAANESQPTARADEGGQTNAAGNLVLAAINNLAPGAEARAQLQSVLAGPVPTDPEDAAIRTEIISRVLAEADRLQREDAALNGAQRDEAIYEESTDQEADGFDQTLVEGVDEAPRIRAAHNRVRVVKSFDDAQSSPKEARQRAEAQATALNERSENEPYQVVRKVTNAGKTAPVWQVVEVRGHQTQHLAETAMRRLMVPVIDEDGITQDLPKDPSVGSYTIAERGGQYFVQENLLPDALASSNLMTLDPELRSYEGTENTQVTEQAAVDAFIANNHTKATKARRKQQANKRKAGDEQAVREIDDSIIVMEDERGTRREFIGTDITTLGHQLLASQQGSTTDLEGQRYWHNAFTSGMAALRERGFAPVRGQNLQGAIIAGNRTWGREPAGTAIRYDQLEAGDREVRRQGAYRPERPFAGGGVDPITDQVALDDAQRSLAAADRVIAATQRQISEMQAQPDAHTGLYDEQISRLNGRIRTAEFRKQQAENTLANFTPEGETQPRVEPVEDFQGEGLENQGEQPSSLVQEGDDKRQADGTNIDQARRSIPTDRGPVQETTQSAQSDGLTDADGNPLRRTVGYGRVGGKTTMNFVDGILKEVGLTDTAMVVGNANNTQELFDDNHLTAEERQMVDEALRDPERLAVFVPKGRTGVIVVKANKDRDMFLHTLGHEVGHGVYNALEDVIRNPRTARERNLQERLFGAYRADREQDANYSAAHGFKEWFADKVAARARGIAQRKDRGLAERYFQSSADALRKVFNRVKGNTHPRMRFNRNTKFENVIKAYTKGNVFAEMQSFGYGEMESMTVPPVVNAAKTLGTRKLSQGVNMLRNLALRGQDAAVDGFKFVLDNDNRLRMMELAGIADLIYKKTNTTGNDKAFWNQVDIQRAEWIGRSQQAMSRKMDPRLQRMVFDQLVRELPDSELTTQAKQLRKVFKDFYQYLLDAGIPVEEVENFWPRQYDTAHMLAKPDEFVQILMDHGFTEKDARETLEDMTSPDEFNTLRDFSPKRLALQYGRTIPVEAARDLIDGGYLNTDPEAGLRNYILKSVRSAEMMRAFGGYLHLDGTHTESTIRRESDVVKQQRMRDENRRLTTQKFKEYGFWAQTDKNGTEDERFAQAETLTLQKGWTLKEADGTLVWLHADTALKAQLNDAVEQNIKAQQMDPMDAARYKKMAHDVVQHSLDAQALPDRDSLLYNAIGEVRAYESLRTLLFSGIASVPEIAAVFARAKGELNMGEFTRIVADTMKNFDDVRDFAEAVGAVERDVSSAILTEMLTHYDTGEGKTHFFRSMVPLMFKYNGNQKIVDYSRMVGLSAGTQFLKSAARQAANGSARHKRYLDELGIDVGTVMRWANNADHKQGRHDAPGTGDRRAMLNRGNNQYARDSQAVRNAVNRFINEAILRPNAAERPTWATHPVGTFVFHLKTFMYTYSKRIMGGMYREMQSRAKEGTSNDQALREVMTFLLPTIGMFMVFGAMSDELRNRIQSLGEDGTWAKNNEDPVKTVGKWMDRSGLVTSLPFFDPIYDTITGNPSAYSIAFGLGPTASHLYDLFGDDNGVTQNELVRSIPGVSQMPAVREQLYS